MQAHVFKGRCRGSEIFGIFEAMQLLKRRQGDERGDRLSSSRENDFFSAIGDAVDNFASALAQLRRRDRRARYVHNVHIVRFGYAQRQDRGRRPSLIMSSLGSPTRMLRARIRSTAAVASSSSAVDWERAGARCATGRPRLEKTIVSPCSAASRSSVKSVMPSEERSINFAMRAVWQTSPKAAIEMLRRSHGLRLARQSHQHPAVDKPENVPRDAAGDHFALDEKP